MGTLNGLSVMMTGSCIFSRHISFHSRSEPCRTQWSLLSFVTKTFLTPWLPLWFLARWGGILRSCPRYPDPKVTLSIIPHLSTLWLDRSLRRGHFTRYYLTGWSPRVSARWCRRYPLFPTLSCAQAPFVSSLYVTKEVQNSPVWGSIRHFSRIAG